MIGIFLLLLVCFVVLSGLYVKSSGKLELARLFDLPVYVTILMLISFGFAPLQAMWNPDKLNENLNGDVGFMVTALLLVVVGMMAFWAACKLVENKSRAPRVVLPQKKDSGRVLTIAGLLYVTGFAAKVYLLGAHMFAYTQTEAYMENLATSQTVSFVAQLATIALVMLCIEKFSDPQNQMARWLFWGVFSSECAWGVVSGMKSVLLTNLLAVALISTILRGKLAKKWVIATVVGLIAIYPLFNSYRAVVKGESAGEVSDFGSAAQALSLAVASGSQTPESSSEWLGSGSEDTISRLDLLQYFALIISFGDRAAQIHSDAELWMIPFYPFVPRIVWASKPILDDSARFTELLTGTRSSATALTYPGDCYIYAGIPGVLAGMFLLGLAAQRFTNQLNGPISKYQVFKYSVLLLTCFRLEGEVFGFWGTIIKTIPVLFVLGWAAYGAVKPSPLPAIRVRPAYTGRA